MPKLKLKAKDKGAIGVLKVAQRGIELGFVVSEPVGDNAGFDLIFTNKAGKSYKVQCKYKERKNIGTYRVEFFRKIKGQKIYYNKNEVDIYAGYLKEEDEVVFLKYRKKLKKVCIRPNEYKHKGGPKSNAHHVRDYLKFPK